MPVTSGSPPSSVMSFVHSYSLLVKSLSDSGHVTLILATLRGLGTINVDVASTLVEAVGAPETVGEEEFDEAVGEDLSVDVGPEATDWG